VRQAFRAYARWRDGRPERHLSFGLFAALTIAALVAFPAQDLPLLVEHDLAVIDLSLVLLAAGTAAAQASPQAARLATHLDPFADSITGTTYVQDTTHGGPIAGRYAAQLLARPHDQAGQLVRASWGRLMDPRTGYADAEQLLDLDHVAPTPAERENEAAEASRHLPPCR
jgi:hypothetical protein